MKTLYYTLFILILMTAGCDPYGTPTGKIDNDDQTVVLYEEETDNITDTSTRSLSRGRKEVTGFEYEITREAQILSVVVDGQAVQANDILISGNQAFVAYNTAGAPNIGALQIIDLSNKKDISIVKEFRFPHRDINALYLDGNDLYFGGQADKEVYGVSSSACLMRVDINNLDAIETESDIETVWLSSWAVTGISRRGNDLYVAVGAQDGGLYTLNTADLSEISFEDAPDARDVDAYQSGFIFLTGQTDNTATSARIHISGQGNTSLSSIDIGTFEADYNKATIEVFNGQYALLGLSNLGFKMIDLGQNFSGTADYVLELENPSVSDPDIKPYTNSVSSDGSLIFTSNGNYGFRVLKKTGSVLSESDIVGFHPFDNLTDSNGEPYSANHIEYKSNLLFVASGVGGVLIFDFDKN